MRVTEKVRPNSAEHENCAFRFAAPGLGEPLRDGSRSLPCMECLDRRQRRDFGTHNCTDHLIALNAAHLQRLLRSYVEYYNRSRTHMALLRNAPFPRAPASAPANELVTTPVLGGLHHTYARDLCAGGLRARDCRAGTRARRSMRRRMPQAARVLVGPCRGSVLRRGSED